MGNRDGADRGRLHRLQAYLGGLHTRAASIAPADYLSLQGSPGAIRRHARAFLWYLPHLPTAGRILDWGCFHAPDAAMLALSARERAPGSVERGVLDGSDAGGPAGTILHGCDVPPPARVRPALDVFHAASGLRFLELAHPVRLPYEDEMFAAVIGSGVLEHAAQESASLTELWRVTRPGGRLVLTFLPNRASLSEAACRLTGRPSHRRLYTPRRIRQLLLSHGFIPRAVRHQQFIPSMRLQRLFAPLGRMDPVLERVWPVRSLCSNLMVVAERVRMV